MLIIKLHVSKQETKPQKEIETDRDKDGTMMTEKEGGKKVTEWLCLTVLSRTEEGKAP